MREDGLMDARKFAAQFAAHAWYQESRAGEPSADEAARFARDNWAAFLPVADEGWGRLLLRVVSRWAGRGRRRRPVTPGAVAAG
jgi:hypothetical protein